MVWVAVRHWVLLGYLHSLCYEVEEWMLVLGCLHSLYNEVEKWMAQSRVRLQVRIQVQVQVQVQAQRLITLVQLPTTQQN